MPITRRSLFKYLGAAIVAAPFLLSEPAQAAECGIVPPEREFLEKTPNCAADIGLTPYDLEGDFHSTETFYRDNSQVAYWGNDVLEPETHYQPVENSTWRDPLGTWGYVSWKVTLPNGKQYANFIQFTDPGDDTLVESLTLLREQMNETMALVAPNVKIKKGRVFSPLRYSQDGTTVMKVFGF